MNMHPWLHRFRYWLTNLPAALPSPGSSHTQDGSSATMFRNLAGRNPELVDLQEQVATEQQGRIALVSRCSELPCWLLAALREQAPLTDVPPITFEGFFTLVTVPDAPDHAGDRDADFALDATQPWVHVEVTDILHAVDLIVYLVDDAHPHTYGWPAADDRWYARLRSSPAPVLPVLVGSTRGGDPAGVHKEGAAPTPGGELSSRIKSLHRHLGTKPIYLPRNIEGDDQSLPASSLDELIHQILELRPRLAIPLAQDVPAGRHLIARRIVRSGAFMAALLGMEPLPLLDLPLTVLVQWKMALQLAAIHGRPGVEVFSREMVGTVGINLLARTLAQQALKFLPVLGWLLSAALNFSTTWLLGQALLRTYGEQRLLLLPRKEGKA